MRIIISIIIFLTYSFVFSQENEKIDSLKLEIKKNKSLYKNYSELAWEYINTNIDSTNIYLLKIENLKLDEVKEGQFFNLKCAYYLLKQDFERSLLNGNKCEKISLKYNDYKTLGSVYNSISTVYRFKGNYKECEKYLFKSLDYRKKTGDNEEIINSYKNIAAYYTTISNNEKAIEYFNLVLGKEKKELNKISTYINIGYLYNQLENPKKSIIYFEKANRILKQIKYEHILTPNLYLNWSSSLVKLLKFDQAIEKGLKGLSFNCEPTIKAGIYLNLAESYINIDKLNLAEKYTLLALKIDEETGYLNGVATDYLLLGKILTQKKEFIKSKVTLFNSIKLLKETKDSINLISGYENYIRNALYEKNDTLTNTILDDYIDLLNIRTSTNTINKLNEIETKYRTAEKEAQIKTQQLQLEKEKYNKILLISALGVLLLFSLGGYFWNRNRQKRLALQNQNELLKLQQNFNQLELQNLNQQLDPHEVKNLLASISPEIQEKAPDAYQKMLKLFKLTRATLNNKSMTESLDIQLQQIEDYLSLEKTMLNHPLHFEIDNQIIEKEVQIPRLLLKNLVENALKHGIKNKTGEGHIQILTIEKEQNYHIIVDDDGVGRKKSIALDTGLGTGTYQNLFAILNQKNKSKADLEIIDKEHGTKVVVKIPVDYKYV